MSEESIAHEWLAARNIIADFLQEMRPLLPRDLHKRNAAAIIARLAAHEPPILLESAGEQEKAIAGTVREEREACACVAEMIHDVYNLGNCIASDIRARGAS
jgi:hypothetical protein